MRNRHWFALAAKHDTFVVVQPSDPKLEKLLSTIEGDRVGLMRALIALLDDSMIREIAEADHALETGENEAVLRGIVNTGNVPCPLQWNPGEALQLTRWIEPGKPPSTPAARVRREHIMRAFVCAVLLHDTNYGGDGANDDVARLIDSAFALGDDVALLTLPFLRWCVGAQDIEREERVFFALAIIIMILTVHQQQHEPLVPKLIEWMMSEARQLHAEDSGPGGRFFWGVTFFDMSRSIWSRLLESTLNTRSDLEEWSEIATRLIHETRRHDER